MSKGNSTQNCHEAQLARCLQRISHFSPMLRDAINDRNGFQASMLSRDHVSLAACRWMLGEGAEAVREAWAESTKLSWSLFERLAAGEPIDHSYFTWLVYQESLIACAAGMFDIAAGMLAAVRARGKAADDVHTFDRRLGRAVAELILDATGDSAIRAFDAYLVKPADRHFVGFAHGMAAIRAGDGGAFAAALAKIAAGHKPLASKGLFRGTDNEHLSMWGIGLCRLARHRGLSFTFDHQFLPAELIRD